MDAIFAPVLLAGLALGATGLLTGSFGLLVVGSVLLAVLLAVAAIRFIAG